MTHYATTYLRFCSCHTEENPLEFTIQDHKEFAEMMREGRTMLDSYRRILSKFYPIKTINDVRVCCMNSLFTGHGQMSGYTQITGSPEELSRVTNYESLPEVMNVDPHDHTAENDIDIDIHAGPDMDEVEEEIPKSSDPSIIIKGFQVDSNGEPIRVSVGLGYTVRVLDTNSDIFLQAQRSARA